MFCSFTSGKITFLYPGKKKYIMDFNDSASHMSRSIKPPTAIAFDVRLMISIKNMQIL